MEKTVRYDVWLKSISKAESKGVENCGKSSDVVQFRDSESEDKAAGRAGGSKDSNVELLFGRDQDGQDQE